MDPDARAPLSDQELVAETLRHPPAYGALVERYTPRLLRYARRLGCRTDHDAKDVLQEVFLKAYLNLRSYDDGLPFSSWIYRICHNETVSFFRKQNVRPQPAMTEDEALALEGVADPRDPLGGIEAGLLRERLSGALAELDPVSREVLILRFFEEKSYEEIADILRRPPGTVATLLSRGKQKLKRILTGKSSFL